MDKEEKLSVYTFSNTLLQFLKERATVMERLMVKRQLDLYLEGWRTVTKPEPPAVTARALVMLTDHLVKQSRAAQRPEISCREGCAHCCRQQVMISDQEAALLLKAAEHNDLTLDKQKLQEQAKIEGEGEWAKKPKDQRSCIFLGADNRCQVYEARPMACRKYFSISNPDSCDIDKHGGQSSVLMWFSLNAEVLSTAVMTHFSADSMPRQLLRLMEQKEGKDNAGADGR
jgi:Fe-S-cluster containining protein